METIVSEHPYNINENVEQNRNRKKIKMWKVWNIKKSLITDVQTSDFVHIFEEWLMLMFIEML